MTGRTARQMMPEGRRIRASSGREFELARPSIALRLKVVDFVERAAELEAAAQGGDSGALRELCGAMVELLVPWLSRSCAGITADEIASEFDTSDIPRFMEIINGYEREVAEASPPPRPPRKPRRTGG